MADLKIVPKRQIYLVPTGDHRKVLRDRVSLAPDSVDAGTARGFLPPPARGPFVNVTELGGIQALDEESAHDVKDALKEDSQRGRLTRALQYAGQLSSLESSAQQSLLEEAITFDLAPASVEDLNGYLDSLSDTAAASTAEEWRELIGAPGLSGYLARQRLTEAAAGPASRLDGHAWDTKDRLDFALLELKEGTAGLLSELSNDLLSFSLDAETASLLLVLSPGAAQKIREWKKEDWLDATPERKLLAIQVLIGAKLRPDFSDIQQSVAFQSLPQDEQEVLNRNQDKLSAFPSSAYWLKSDEARLVYLQDRVDELRFQEMGLESPLHSIESISVSSLRRMLNSSPWKTKIPTQTRTKLLEMLSGTERHIRRNRADLRYLLATLHKAEASEVVKALEHFTQTVAFFRTGQSTSPPMGTKTGADIFYLGLTENRHTELRFLRRNQKTYGAEGQGLDHRTILTVASGEVLRLDIRVPRDLNRLLDHLALTGENRVRMAKLLFASFSNGVDELIQLAVRWASGDQPSRLVLAGHHVGELYGEEGRLEVEHVAELARIFSPSSQAVRHIIISACNSATDGHKNSLVEAFPNLQTLVFYQGTSPYPGPVGSGGSLDHLKWWSDHTSKKPDGQALLDERVPRHFRHRTAVQIRRREDGFLPPSDRGNAEELWTRIQSEEELFQSYLNGRELRTPYRGPLRDYYTQVQKLLAFDDLPPSRRAWLSQRRDVAIRLLYQESIMISFMSQHRDTIDALYKSTGRAPFDFRVHSRSEGLREFKALEEAVAKNPQAEVLQSDLALMRAILVDMSPAHIPDSWM